MNVPRTSITYATAKVLLFLGLHKPNEMMCNRFLIIGNKSTDLLRRVLRNKDTKPMKVLFIQENYYRLGVANDNAVLRLLVQHKGVVTIPELRCVFFETLRIVVI